jgi:hypothetical protein
MVPTRPTSFPSHIAVDLAAADPVSCPERFNALEGDHDRAFERERVGGELAINQSISNASMALF